MKKLLSLSVLSFIFLGSLAQAIISFYCTAAMAQATPSGLDQVDSILESYLSFGKDKIICTDLANGGEFEGTIKYAVKGDFMLQFNFDLNGRNLKVDVYRAPMVFHQASALYEKLAWMPNSNYQHITSSSNGTFTVKILKVYWNIGYPQTLDFLDPSVEGNWITGKCRIKNPFTTQGAN